MAPPRSIASRLTERAGGAVATKGRIIEYDDQSGNDTGIRMSGVIFKQDPTAFASGDTSHLKANYAFGVSGIGMSTGIAVGGSFTLTSSSGVIPKMTFDEDFGGQGQGTPSTATAIITNVSAKTGRALFLFTSTTSTFAPTGLALYIVNANEIFLASIEPLSIGFPGSTPASRYAGRAIVSSANSSSAQLSGNFVFHLAGTGSVALGAVTLTSSGSTGGSSSGTLEGYNSTQGTANIPLTGTYTVDAATGRVSLSTGAVVPLPFLYLAAPVTGTENITAFIIGQDPFTLFGLVEPGATSAVATNSLAGKYFFGDEFPRDGNAPNRVGIVAIASSGAATGTEDDSATSGLSTKSVSYTVNIDNANGFGTGNVGANSVALTNGTELFFFANGTGAPASLTVVEKQ